LSPIAVHLGVGLLLSASVAGVAWRVRALTLGGAAAATAVGAVIYGFGGVKWAVLLLVFFLTSSTLTRTGGEHKSPSADRAGRTAGQVAANGAIAAAFALAYWGTDTPWIAAGFAGAIAAATADTWATEIGLLTPTPPRLITSREICRPGQSGGVTSLGTRGGIAGASAIALLGNLLLGTSVLGVLIAGTAAMLVDSLLGATLEARARLLTNNSVNLLTTAIGALLAALLGTRLP
jgi:uncharacterized protein (TIGR00297 family)